MDTSVRRGDIFYADLSPVVGSEQGGVRPVLIIQNDMGNRHSPTVIAAAITSQLNKAKLPTHIELLDPHCGLTKDSVVLLEQIRTLDKRRLRERMGRLDEEKMAQVDTAIAVSFGLRSQSKQRRLIRQASLLSCGHSKTDAAKHCVCLTSKALISSYPWWWSSWCCCWQWS